MMFEKLCVSTDQLVSHQQLACWHSLCAVLNGRDIQVYSHGDVEEKVTKIKLLLAKHRNSNLNFDIL